MRIQLFKLIYGLTSFLLAAMSMSAIQPRQITQSPDFYAFDPGVDFTTGGESGPKPVPLIAGEPDGQACGTGTSKKKKLRVRQDAFCTENSRQPALNSQEQFPGASPGILTIPNTLPGSYTQEHTGHEKLVRYCPEIDYTAHLCCDGPEGPLELTPGLIHFKYVDFCQGRRFSLFAGTDFLHYFGEGCLIELSSGQFPYLPQGVGCVLQITCEPYVFSRHLVCTSRKTDGSNLYYQDTLNLIKMPGISCVPSVPVGA